MGYVSALKPDVFVSYSHADNETAATTATQEDPDAWVSQLHTRLRIRLRQLLGEAIDVWRDVRLGAADSLDEQISDRVGEAAVLLAIVSPGYQKSSWCKRERADFRKAADGLNRVGGKARIVKAVKTPLENDEHRGMYGSLGCEFYTKNDKKLIVEFAADSAEFATKLEELAQEIAGILDGMRRLATVFIGHAPSAQLDNDRIALCKELDAKGFHVLRGPEPSNDDAERLTQRAMEDATLSVHFVDTREDSTMAVFELGEAHARGVKPVVRLASPVIDSPTFDGAIIVSQEHGVEKLKEDVLERLRRAKVRRRSDAKNVFLVCARSDHPVAQSNVAQQIRDYLADRGYEVVLPRNDVESESESTDDRKENLTDCDAVLVYWQNSKEFWVNSQWPLLDKAKGYRRARDFVGTGLYITDPKNPRKELYAPPRAGVIVMREWQGFSPLALEPFLGALQASDPNSPNSPPK